MLLDDLPFNTGKLEFFLGISESASGMGESVKGVAFSGVMPIIKKIIVEKRSAYQFFLSKFQMEIPGKIIAVISHRDAMQQNRSISVLDISVGRPKSGTGGNIV